MNQDYVPVVLLVLGTWIFKVITELRTGVRSIIKKIQRESHSTEQAWKSKEATH